MDVTGDIELLAFERVLLLRGRPATRCLCLATAVTAHAILRFPTIVINQSVLRVSLHQGACDWLQSLETHLPAKERCESDSRRVKKAPPTLRTGYTSAKDRFVLDLPHEYLATHGFFSSRDLGKRFRRMLARLTVCGWRAETPK